jgi:hypothetical protein
LEKAVKLPLLIKTEQQLRKVLRKGSIENLACWDRAGPCSDFIKTAATQITILGIDYIVFMAWPAFHEKLIADNKGKT